MVTTQERIQNSGRKRERERDNKHKVKRQRKKIQLDEMKKLRIENHMKSVQRREFIKETPSRVDWLFFMLVPNKTFRLIGIFFPRKG